MILRPFQESFVSDVRAAYATGARSVLGCAPTGAGKTVIMAHMMRGLVERRHRVLFACHRDELITQTSEKLHAYGVDHGTLSAGYHFRPSAPVQVATIQSAVRRQFRDISFLFFDEAHLSQAASWLKLREQYANARLFGASATPTRLDGKAFSGMYDRLVIGPSTAQLMAAGHLVPYRMFAPTVPDLTGVHTVGGDYSQKELTELLGKPKLVGDAVSHWRKLAPDRLTIVFCVGVEHSKKQAAEFQAAGVSAAHLDGAMKRGERRRILDDFRAGKIRVLCSVMLFTEGFDCPEVSCVVLLRPTQSEALYLQMVGRGLRICAGKSDCLILDHSSNALRLGMPDDEREWSLEARSRKLPGDEDARSTRLPKVCPRCCGVCPDSCRACPCGWVFAISSGNDGPEVVEGSLVEMQRPIRPIEEYGSSNDAVISKIIEKAHAKGFKPGYVHIQKQRLFEARAKYADAFGVDAKEHYSTETINAMLKRAEKGKVA